MFDNECVVNGHQGNKALAICSNPLCEQGTRLICFLCSQQKIHESDPNYEVEFIIQFDVIDKLINDNNKLMKLVINEMLTQYYIQLKIQGNELKQCWLRYSFIKNKIDELKNSANQFLGLSVEDYINHYSSTKQGIYDFLCLKNNQIMDHQIKENLEKLIKWTLLEDDDLDYLKNKINQKGMVFLLLDLLLKNKEFNNFIEILGKTDKQLDEQLQKYNPAFSHGVNIEKINQFMINLKDRQSGTQGFNLQNSRILNRYMKSQIVQGRGKDYLYYQLKGQLMSLTNDPNNEVEIINIFNKAFELNPNNTDTLILIGDYYKQIKKYDRSIEYYDEILLKDNQNYSALYNKGYCLQKITRYEQARIVLINALTFYPNSQEIQYQLAHIHIQQKQYQLAIVILNQLLRKYPHSQVYKKQLAHVYECLKKHNVAVKIYEDILKYDQYNVSILELLGFNLNQQQQYQKALSYYNQILQQNKNKENILILKGQVLLKLEQYEQSIQIFDQVIKIYPSNIEGYLNKGNVLRTMKQNKQEIEVYLLALQNNVHKPEIYVRMAQFYLQHEQNFQKAEEFIEQALKIDCFHIDANYQKSLLYMSQEKFGLALQMCEKFITIYPQSPDFYFLKGLCYQRNKKLDLAIQSFNLAIQVDDKLAVAINNRAFAYYELGQFKKAIDDFDQAIQLNCDVEISILNKGNLLCYTSSCVENEQIILRSSRYYRKSVDAKTKLRNEAQLLITQMQTINLSNLEDILNSVSKY